ncbi:hypothetical protein [Goodfellowiella coeruleoviolacea]|uniref:Guanylate cyclase domain-containing protein n=1 Tax=Goodfellowiella coeruleoviolacea TaxID=334858 RepID=A0AAE3GG78_9PSEU|nr:hypothetical protein [Goodfellowiella coeruleoviolacea]MCP2166779.1 hypothetical protein [Goodfellowiella coeruleoviolacea]
MGDLPSPSTPAFTTLPPYRAVLVVDIKDFSGNKGVHHERLSESVPLILENAFQRVGCGFVWQQITFPDSTGDGYAVGLPAEYLPLLVDPFLAGLQSELEYHHRLAPRAGHDERLRMRVSISVGPLTDSGQNRVGDGKGHARIETHRLLDAQPVRDLLDRSNPDVTLVAAILSARAYEDVVAAGYTGLAESQFVPAPVQVKTYQGTAYLHVPRPSGGLLTEGFTLDSAAPAAATPAHAEATDTAPAPAHAGISGVTGLASQARDVTHHRTGGIGDIGQVLGPVNTGTQGNVQTGSGQQFNGDFSGNNVTGSDVRGGIGRPGRASAKRGRNK